MLRFESRQIRLWLPCSSRSMDSFFHGAATASSRSVPRVRIRSWANASDASDAPPNRLCLVVSSLRTL